MCVQRLKESIAGLELMNATTTDFFFLRIVLCGATVLLYVVTGTLLTGHSFIILYDAAGEHTYVHPESLITQAQILQTSHCEPCPSLIWYSTLLSEKIHQFNWEYESSCFPWPSATWCVVMVGNFSSAWWKWCLSYLTLLCVMCAFVFGVICVSCWSVHLLGLFHADLYLVFFYMMKHEYSGALWVS